MEKKPLTIYVSSDLKKLLDHLYALKIINGQSCSRGDIITEAIILLAQRDGLVEIIEHKPESDA